MLENKCYVFCGFALGFGIEKWQGIFGGIRVGRGNNINVFVLQLLALGFHITSLLGALAIHRSPAIGRGSC